MIYLYPANRMENLLSLLNKIQQVSPLPFFSEDVIVVQNAGMQHWLNMSIAKKRGVAMNIRYALPAQFLWKLIRTVASGELVPEQSPYAREVLTWRIYQILHQDDVLIDTDFHAVNVYWQGDSGQIFEKEKADLKCYQLACKVADLFEQYLIFRPEWIDDWCNDANHNVETFIDNDEALNHLLSTSTWQRKLWLILHRQLPYNPITLVESAIENLAGNKHLLPKRLSFFGLNAMAPMWLEFLQALSKYTDVHFFHLNPCFNYWGDILTEKQAFKKLSQWTDNIDEIQDNVANPLLANLGQQGREFIAQIQDYSTINIDIFEKSSETNNSKNSEQYSQNSNAISLIHHIQDDILSLSDARVAPRKLIDDSLIITSCHSALREVQALHDWLLHQFNDDCKLTPKDVLVMCPQIEDYAPYVNAVFARGWQDIDDDVPPLPCSIADRSSQSTDPNVVAFVEMLNLPDSRFQVSHIMSLLRLPSVQKRLTITYDELSKIEVWLDNAAVHWGRDQEHKKQVLGQQDVTVTYTWQQGLKRLLKGFAYGDNDSIVDGELLLPNIEGQDAILLGKLLLFIEQLQTYSLHLSQSRTAVNWQLYLTDLVENLFEVDEQQSFRTIFSAIETLTEYTELAGYRSSLNLAVMKEFLTHHFSQPDPGRQFMVGQVTFCSMLPMRSIPFKVIAVLGLNDGQFPRQRQPLAFDLMAMTPSKQGDRSRRGDDRYLFLEALISARQSLYLSYQGRSINNNTEKQPSIVLQELIAYLEQGFGWDVEKDIRQMSMQPFSLKNYLYSTDKFNSFDKNWLALNQSENKQTEILKLPSQFEIQSNYNPNHPESLPVIEVTSEDLVKFFQHPAKIFSKQELNLNFDDYGVELSDVEPFTFNHLASYNLREEMVADFIESSQNVATSDAISKAKLRGKFAENPLAEKEFEGWFEDSQEFAEIIKQYISTLPAKVCVSIEIDVAGQPVKLTSYFPTSGEHVLFYRSSTAKGKDKFEMYLHQLILQYALEHQETNVSHCSSQALDSIVKIKTVVGLYFNTKTQKTMKYQVQPIENVAEKLVELLKAYFEGLTTPLLLNLELADKINTSRVFEQSHFEKYWDDENSFSSLGKDAYIQYYWSTCPELDVISQRISQLYDPMFEAVKKVKL